MEESVVSLVFTSLDSATICLWWSLEKLITVLKTLGLMIYADRFAS